MRYLANEHLAKRLEGIQRVLMAHYEAGMLMPSASKGFEREILVSDYFAQVFPPSFRFGTGSITDASGVDTGQVDIVVEWPFFPSFPTPGGAVRLYLADSVALAVEVKSDLAGQWDEIESKVRKVRALRRNWDSHFTYANGRGPQHHGKSTSSIPVVAVGFRGYKSLEALKKRLEATPVEARPDAALIIESGVYRGVKAWTEKGSVGLLALGVDFAYFLSNVIAALPDFGSYLRPLPAITPGSGASTS